MSLKDILAKHYNIPEEVKYTYIDNLRFAKPFFYTKDSINKLNEIQRLHYFIPPINTDIRFSSKLPYFKLSDYTSDLYNVNVPTTFTWRDKKNIAKPSNQGLCGSCWALVTADVIGDNLVVSNIVNWKPNISTTWSLACYPQDQCQGGNPAELLLDIAKNGVVDNTCLDYSWCTKDDKCNGEFNNNIYNIPMKILNNNIPKCACKNIFNNRLLYFVEPTSKIIAINPSLNITQDNVIDIIKKHIYKYGSVIGGFTIFENFREGKFTKINDGIYFENGIYDNDQITFSDDQINSDKIVGTHVVSVIGWGISKNIIVDNNGTRKDVPYWECRNSWGENWGDGGYFKIAMYPWNKKVQFIKEVQINDLNNKTFTTGGIILINTKKPPIINTMLSNTYNLKYVIIFIICTLIFLIYLTK
jgi:hypothetical protein